MDIEQFFRERANRLVESRPLILNLKDQNARLRVKDLIERQLVQRVVDDYAAQEREYFEVIHPDMLGKAEFENVFKEYLEVLEHDTPIINRGRWIFYPWLFTLVHLLDGGAFQTVRTARNKNLIFQEEQEKFYNSVVGIAGLSVGSSVALAIVLQGGAKHLRLADYDHLALSNINRIPVGIENLGLQKTEVIARQIYTLNPYATVELFQEGLTESNMESFFNGPPRLDLVIDELDNFVIKYLIRDHARAQRLPVVMAADNGNTGVIDIERYDETPNLEPFHGRLGSVAYKNLLTLNKIETGRMIVKLVGADNVSEEMHRSLLEIGKTIVSWPQLGGTALLNGAAVAYAARRILNKQPLENNRSIVSLDEKFIPNYDAPESKEGRRRAAEEFTRHFAL